jgi:Uma2 family endonuclease
MGDGRAGRRLRGVVADRLGTANLVEFDQTDEGRRWIGMSIDVWPDHLLTLTEWEALPEDSAVRYELMEGTLQVTPRPTPLHQLAMLQLGAELNRQLPAELTAVPDVDVLIDGVFPPTVRAPDVVVVSTATIERRPPRFDAADVLLAVEIISPGTRRTDRVIKPSEYAEAGIRHYWLVDLDPPVSLTAYLLVGGGYELDFEGSGRISIGSPAVVQLDLDQLLTR